MLSCPDAELFQMKPYINKEDTGAESFRQEYVSHSVPGHRSS